MGLLLLLAGFDGGGGEGGDACFLGCVGGGGGLVVIEREAGICRSRKPDQTRLDIKRITTIDLVCMPNHTPYSSSSSSSHQQATDWLAD